MLEYKTIDMLLTCSLLFARQQDRSLMFAYFYPMTVGSVGAVSNRDEQNQTTTCILSTSISYLKQSRPINLQASLISGNCNPTNDQFHKRE